MTTPIQILLVTAVALCLLSPAGGNEKSESRQGHLAAAVAATVVPAANPPWAVPPQVVIKKQPMSFTSAGAQLSGTFHYPEKREKLAAAVVFHAAGEPSQDSQLYTHLKQMLPPIGIAVFVFDRRGTGQSGGERGMQDFDMLSDDGVAAFNMLAQDARIDPKRIGFWGLSQGGWLTLLAAGKEPRAAFAVSVSAPMVKADVQMIFASTNILHTYGYPTAVIDQAIATRRAIDGYVRGKVDRATVEPMLDAAEQQPWFKQIYLSRTMIESNSSWRQQIESDPMRSLVESRVPTLLIFGQEDMWIPVGETIRLLEASGTQRGDLTVRVVFGASHEMMLGADPKDAIDPALFSKLAPNAPEYFGLLSSWLTERGIAASSIGRVLDIGGPNSGGASHGCFRAHR